MSQEFSYLGIDIDDFLGDLTKIGNEEMVSFQMYNNWIKRQPYKTNSNKDIPTSPITDKGQSEDNLDHKKNQQIPTSTATSPAVITTKEPIPPTPTNLLKKFVSADEDSCSKPSKFLDKPIIL
jgi:hypothetical protein